MPRRRCRPAPRTRPATPRSAPTSSASPNEGITVPTWTCSIALIVFAGGLRAEDIGEKELAERLRKLDTNVLATDAEKAKALSRMLSDDVSARLREANRKSTEAWAGIG